MDEGVFPLPRYKKIFENIEFENDKFLHIIRRSLCSGIYQFPTLFSFNYFFYSPINMGGGGGGA